MNPLKYYSLQVFWRSSGFLSQFASCGCPKKLFYIISHERSGTHFLINTIHKNTAVRRGHGRGVGAGWGFHNIGEWYGPYDQPGARFAHIDSVNRQWCRLASRAAIIKSHCDRDLFVQKFMPAPIIYIYRDPRDTLVSWFHYLNQERYYRIHPYIEDHRCASISDFIRRPVSDFLKFNYSIEPAFENVVERWAAHVSGWLNSDNPSVLPIQFCELKSDPFTVLEKISTFAGLKVNDHFRSVSLLGSGSMLPRKGLVGGWKTILTDQDERFIRDVAERYGLNWGDVTSGS